MANRANLSGNNITGVSGAQQGATKNAQAMQPVSSASQSANYEFGTLGGTTGAAGANAGATGAAGAANAGAGNARQKNAKAIQRASQKAGQ